MRRILFSLTVMLFFCSIGKAICVSSSSAKLRDKPSNRAAVKWTVGKYMPLKQLDRQGNWIKVSDMDGEVSWVYASSVTKSYRCLVVKVPFTYLRTGPGSQYSKAEFAVADKYTPFKKLERKDSWLHVEDDYGKRFWVYADNLWEPIIMQRIEF